MCHYPNVTMFVKKLLNNTRELANTIVPLITFYCIVINYS